MALLEQDIRFELVKFLCRDQNRDADQSFAIEFPVNNGARRVDLALADTHLHAFEIKSKADSLTRLSGQIETYQRYFDEVTAVVHPRHLKATRKIVPSTVGIWLISESMEKTSFKVIRKARPRRQRETKDMLGMFTVKELRGFLNSSGIHARSKDSRWRLINLAQQLRAKSIRDGTLELVKQRYRDANIAFQESLCGKQMSSDLSLVLRRRTSDVKFIARQKPVHQPRLKTSCRSESDEDIFSFWRREGGKLSPFGPVPEDVVSALRIT